MAEKSGNKGRKRNYPKIDEDNDVFLSFINKKKRNNKKKLTEIEELEKRDPSTLKPEQVAKIKKRPEISKENDYWHEIKDLYYQALKSNQEEGTKKQPLKKEAPQTQEKAQPKEETQKAQPTEKPKGEIIRPVLGLLHLHQLFKNPAAREEFDKGYMNMSQSLGLTTFPDFTAVHDFAEKVFHIATQPGQTVGKKLDEGVHQLEAYLNGANEKAAHDKTYGYIADVVNKITASDFFRQHKAIQAHEEHKHHETPHKHVEPVHKQVEPTHKHVEPTHKHVEPVHKHETSAHKQKSPEKTTQHEQPKEEAVTKGKTTTEQKTDATRPPQESTENWGDYEEEEGEEYEEEVEEKKSPTEKKAVNPDDGFIEVKAKYLEKKEGQPVRGGERRGGRGGRRGGRRGGAEGGDRGERRGGFRRRGGDGEHRGGQEGGEGGQRRGGRRGGDFGGRRRGGKEEYVPKKQEGTTQPETKTQP